MDRRIFLVGAGVGLTLIGAVPGRTTPTGPLAKTALSQTFLRIDLDGTVTVLAKHLDMGQGIWSGLASIVAEELDAAPAQMRVEGAPAAPAYKHTRFGAQVTGGSTSIADSWDQLRLAAATVRMLLVQAAADRWRVPAAAVSIQDGVVSAGGRKAGFGELAAAAAKLPVPTSAMPKSPDRYRLLGKGWKRLDAADKSLGRTRFASDLHLPGMLTAVIAWPPKFGATLTSVDDAAALAVPGVRQVVRVPQGVGVIAADTWSAFKGRAALKLAWDDGQAEARSTEAIAVDFTKALEQPGLPVKTLGDVDAAFARAHRTLSADYVFPYLAHAAMEPLAAVCRIGEGDCELWGGFQSQTNNQKTAAGILGLAPEQVRLNTLYAGGSFGRRATFDSDWVAALVEVTRASGLKAPVKLVYTREDDMRSGYYRPLSVHRLEAALNAEGALIGVKSVIASQSLLFGGPRGDPALKKVDPTAVGGGLHERYDCPAVQARWVSMKAGPTVHTFRGVSFNTTSYAKEVFMDELAHAAGIDPLAFRLRHLAGSPRQAAVLRLAADKAGWGRAMPPGRALGLSAQESDDTFVAQVAEVELGSDGVRVHRVVCAIDCGFALNPDNVRAQVEGGVGFAIGHALTSEITLERGAVAQSNFDTYPPLRIDAMPSVEVHIIDSGAKPTGVGEPGGNPTAAAVANALFRLTGRPVRRLPLSHWLKAQQT